jgi:hypothetical protein
MDGAWQENWDCRRVRGSQPRVLVFCNAPPRAKVWLVTRAGNKPVASFSRRATAQQPSESARRNPVQPSDAPRACGEENHDKIVPRRVRAEDLRCR